MSSVLTVAEIEVARLALEELSEAGLDVAVGGLGPGYTAKTVLDDPNVRSLAVVETFREVIGWHVRGLIPLGVSLTSDSRCRLAHGDFFAMVGASGFDPESRGRLFHAIVVDIDHSPRHLLHPSHAGFYEPAGVRVPTEHLHPGGVFTLWSKNPPDEDYESVLADVFAEVRAEIVSLHQSPSGTPGDQHGVRRKEGARMSRIEDWCVPARVLVA